MMKNPIVVIDDDDIKVKNSSVPGDLAEANGLMSWPTKDQAIEKCPQSIRWHDPEEHLIPIEMIEHVDDSGIPASYIKFVYTDIENQMHEAYTEFCGEFGWLAKQQLKV